MDQIWKWPNGQRIYGRGQNNKQDPEPWNKTTRFLSRDTRKAQNYDVFSVFPSSLLEPEKIYNISRACRWDRLVVNQTFSWFSNVYTHRTHRRVKFDAVFMSHFENLLAWVRVYEVPFKAIYRMKRGCLINTLQLVLQNSLAMTK